MLKSKNNRRGSKDLQNKEIIKDKTLLSNLALFEKPCDLIFPRMCVVLRSCLKYASDRLQDGVFFVSLLLTFFSICFILDPFHRCPLALTSFEDAKECQRTSCKSMVMHSSRLWRSTCSSILRQSFLRPHRALLVIDRQNNHRQHPQTLEQT